MNNDPYNTSDRNAAPPHDPSSTPQSSQTSCTHVQSTPFTFTPKPKPAYKPLDALFAWLSIAVGFLLVKAMPVTKSTLGGMLFLCLRYCFGGLYL